MSARQRRFRSVIGRWVAVASATAIALATLVPDPGSPDITHICLICGTLSGVDAVLNILLFVPIGIGLALAGVRARTAIASVCSYSLAIEALQLLVVSGRHASVADVITNSLGGILGFVVGQHLAWLLRPRPAIAGRLAASWLAIWLGFLLVIAYSLVPVLPDPPYYGHIGRPHWRSGVVFPGNVLTAAIGAEWLGSGELPNGAQLKALLGQREGAPLQVSVDPAGISPDRSEIVVVSAKKEGFVVSFEQEGAHLILGVRTGADVLLLRPLEFRLRDVFHDSMSARSRDSVLLHGRYGRDMVVLRATSQGMDREWHFMLRLSYGWLLLTPWQIYIDDDPRESLASAAFLAMLILPAGYWGYLSDQSPDVSKRVRRRLMFFLVLAVAFTCGLVAVPVGFGLRPAAPWEWGVCSAGIALGMVIASRIRASASTA